MTPDISRLVSTKEQIFAREQSLLIYGIQNKNNLQRELEMKTSSSISCLVKEKNAYVSLLLTEIIVKN